MPELTLKTAFDFVGGGKNFYLPAYQRSFSWGKENIERLFGDIVEDMGERMVTNDRIDPNVMSFIGGVICFKGNGSLSFHDTEHIPDAVHNIIDGQQRITVLLIASAILHDYIRCGMGVIEYDWLTKRCEEIKDKFAIMLEKKQTNSGGDSPYYPVMIHWFIDQWSRNSNEKKYFSPISYYISSYGNFYRNNTGVPFIYDEGRSIKNPTSAESQAHVDFTKAVNCVQNIIHDICEGNNKNFPKVKRTFCERDSRLLLEKLFDADQIPEPEQINKHQKMARAILLSSYLMQKMQIVLLNIDGEGCALRIFGSLNTTGEPLTAYETFKSAIIRAEGGDGKFAGTHSHKHTQAIEGFLHTLSSKNRQKGTADFLISFVLAEKGDALPRDSRVQQTVLLEMYEKKKIKEKRRFTRRLKRVAEVWQHFWIRHENPDDIIRILKITGCSKHVRAKISQAQFCLNFLQKAKHTIAIPLIARFYEDVMTVPSGNPSARLVKVIELCRVINAIAAFFAIWRGFRDTTEGIDDHHRKMMKEGIHSFKAFSWEKGNPPQSEEVKNTFCWLLKHDGGTSGRKIDGKDVWVTYAKDVPIYRISKPVTKFWQLVACHDTRPCKRTPGHLVSIRSDNILPIESHIWGGEPYQSIEHLVPHNKNDKMHKMGNLTLIPKKANSILSNREWVDKRVIYKMLSAEDENELNQAAAEARNSNVSEAIIRKLCRERYLPITKAIVRYEKFDNSNFDDRGKHLLGRAWEMLSKWLDFGE